MAPSGKVLLIDSDPSANHCRFIEGILEVEDSFRIDRVQCGRAAESGSASSLQLKVVRLRPQLILLFVSAAAIPHWRGFLEFLRSRSPRPPVLAVVDAARSAQVMQLLSWGATDFIVPPLKPVDVLARIERFLRPEQKPSALFSLQAQLGQRLVGESPAFVEVLAKIPQAARSGAPVLISGETGTGKELCARAVHYCSPRTGKPFVPVNCGAIPLDLAENELFGHARMAFTGATAGAVGLIQEAEGGTLFLDEVDSLAAPAQVKLLRLLQEKEYRSLGSPKLRRANLRIVAATQKDPARALQTGKLRRDLYYRLSAICLALPPLRRRRRDIPLLARHFLTRSCDRFDKPPLELSSDALQALCLYDWPGNVRELEHVIEQAVVFSSPGNLCAADLEIPHSPPRQEHFQEAKARYVSSFERRYLEGLLLSCKGNVSRAAKRAGKHRRALYELIRKHGINVQRFRA